jgi:hypothetical protein
MLIWRKNYPVSDVKRICAFSGSHRFVHEAERRDAPLLSGYRVCLGASNRPFSFFCAFTKNPSFCTVKPDPVIDAILFGRASVDIGCASLGFHGS